MIPPIDPQARGVLSEKPESLRNWHTHGATVQFYEVNPAFLKAATPTPQMCENTR